MLRYNVRLGNGNIKKKELVWREKYVANDLSFISGVTDTAYHLEKFKALAATNTINNTDNTLFVTSENVTREGFVVVVGKSYEVKIGKTKDYSLERNGSEITYHYVEINGKYFYWNKSVGGYRINNLVTFKNGEVSYDEFDVTVSEGASEIKIDTVYWIEDGIVTIDGERYVFDKNENDGILKYGEEGSALEPSEITKCDTIEFHPYSSASEFQEVTKFTMTKSEEFRLNVSRVSFVKYFNFIRYKNNYCGIKKKGDGDNYSFVCSIPKYVIDGSDKYRENGLEEKEFDVYFANDIGNDSTLLSDYLKNEFKLNSANYNEHRVKEIDEIKNRQCFVYIDDDDIVLPVENDIMNANNGTIIGIYLEDSNTALSVGESLSFISSGDGGDSTLLRLYEDKGEEFILYDGYKYLVKKNLCDKAVINDAEYDIKYVNGREDGKECLVVIGEEEVPMLITDGVKKVQRYGRILYDNKKPSDITSSAETVGKYEIREYSGITVNKKDYIIYDEKVNLGEVGGEEGKVRVAYAVTDLRNKYRFKVDDIRGSSMLVCTPDIDSDVFSEDFIRRVSEDISSEVVSSTASYTLMIGNKIFGDLPIVSDSPFRKTLTPISSDDSYDLPNDLKIFVDTAYIQVPISFPTTTAINGLQDDIVQRDFYEAEKKKAINPIVDMEKDVYLPKYIYSNTGSYKGSSTNFKPIFEINLNFHFRTRNLDSWKVNDGSENMDYGADDKNGSCDNWFVTDFYPYRGLNLSSKPLGSNETWGDTLQKTSDLMGLLYFTNDDIFYQRSKVAKSFARLSFYDSTDPQTQTLLATSCVFVDEHALFKKYIDNSRKGVYDYGKVSEVEYERDSTTNFISPSVSSITYDTDGSAKYVGSKNDVTKLTKQGKITVFSEFIGTKDKKEYSAVTDSGNVTIDENHRISSRLNISNKYVTETSSEGYYLYMFREYSEGLHPKPIYMKVEFNHAGIGKTIPFLIPMHWEDKPNTKNNEEIPMQALSLSDPYHLTELKEGIPLHRVYAQTYIPLYAVYDFNSKEYGYIFDDRYLTDKTRDELKKTGVLNLNLFEMKIKDESNEYPSAEELEDIKMNRQVKAVINVNEKQFDKSQFNYETK